MFDPSLLKFRYTADQVAELEKRGYSFREFTTLQDSVRSYVIVSYIDPAIERERERLAALPAPFDDFARLRDG